MTNGYEEVVFETKDANPVFRWKEEEGVFEKRQVPSVDLELKNGKVYNLRHKPLSRYLAFLGIGKRKFMDMLRTYERPEGHKTPRKVFLNTETAQKFLETATAKMLPTTEAFKILLMNDKVVRITSDTFIAVKHSRVQEIIENRLHAEGIEFTKEIRFGGVNGVYRFTNTQHEGMENAVSYINRNSGDVSLQIYGGAVVLVCGNGMISGKASSKTRIVHKLSDKDIVRKVEAELGMILERLNTLPEVFLKLKKYAVTQSEARKLVEALNMPKYLKAAIWKRLFASSKKTENGKMDWDGTMWGIYMAATYVASHEKAVSRSLNTTQDMNEDLMQKLAMVETYTTVWDQREKILAETGSDQLSVKS